MRKIIFILAILAGVCVAFSDELRNKTALTIKTSEPFSNSIICSDIDSVTFSNVGLNGIVHDSIVTKSIFTADSVYTYELDSIKSVTLNNVSEYVEISNSYSDLSKYLTETNSEGDTYETVIKKIKVWLGKHPEIKEWKILDDKKGIDIEFNNGYSGFISFIHNADEANEKNVSEKLRNNTVKTSTTNVTNYYNVASVKEERILRNNKILCFQAHSEPILDASYSLNTDGLGENMFYQMFLDKGAIEASIYSNPIIGDLNFLARELPKSEIAIITHTHGDIRTGSFTVPKSALIQLVDMAPDVIMTHGYYMYFIGGYLKLWSTVNWVTPKHFDTFKFGNGIGLLNYCYGDKLIKNLTLGTNNDKQKKFVGYEGETSVSWNTIRVRVYLNLMAHGYTHANAIRLLNDEVEMYAKDGQKFQDDGTCNDRFFSIENTGEPEISIEKDCCFQKYKIKGWKNLKKEINKVKIWYKNERFIHPDSSCMSIEYDLRCQQVINWALNVYWTVMNPCTIEGDFNNDGPDFFMDLALSGIESDSIYYTMGFEYNNGDALNVYHGDIIAVGGISPGVTPGQCIDLGLPSGTRWAGWNIGASRPEETGGSYGWGEPTGTYTEKPGEYFVGDKYISTYSEVVPHYGGENPAHDISGSKYDIARALWGAGWQLPSVEQWEELMNDEYTTWHRYTLAGVEGLRVISKINGHKIFFPTKQNQMGIRSASFWTSELDVNSENKYKAKTAYIDRYFDKEMSKSVGSSSNRWSLLNVRPVKK